MSHKQVFFTDPFMRHKPECCKWEPGPGRWGQGSVTAALVPQGPSAGKDQQHSISGKFTQAKMCLCPPVHLDSALQEASFSESRVD